MEIHNNSQNIAKKINEHLSESVQSAYTTASFIKFELNIRITDDNLDYNIIPTVTMKKNRKQTMQLNKNRI